MKIIDILVKIANGKIEDGTIFYVNGDFFYNLIVIDEELYVINTMTKQLELLGSKYIGEFIRDDVKLLKLNNEVEIIEEKKIPEKLPKSVTDNGGICQITSCIYKIVITTSTKGDDKDVKD